MYADTIAIYENIITIMGWIVFPQIHLLNPWLPVPKHMAKFGDIGFSRK